MKIVKYWQWMLASGAYLVGVILGIVAIYISHIHGQTHPQNVAAATIILHNLGVLAIMFVGIVTFGVATCAVLLFNGLQLGAVLEFFTLQGKLGAVLIALAPHGILETGAFLLGGCGDLILVYCLWNLLKSRKQLALPGWRKAAKQGLIFNFIAILLLCIAGYIEHAVFLTV